MSFDAETLYNLLPAVYRVRDTEQRGPLRELLSVIAKQIAAIEEDLAQLYDDQFIETCAEWVVPYIGDLIGYHTLYGVTPQISSPRAEVANTIGYRRRKGTAAMLEQLARDVTGWDACVVEFFQLLATTQHLNHLRPGNRVTPDLRHWEPLELIGTPFDRLAHTADVRRIASGRGYYNIPNIGIFLWRLRSFALSDSPAFEVDARRYLFSPLGTNLTLFNRPQTETTITHLARPNNVPMPISRRVLDECLDDYYGEGKSLWITVDGEVKGSEQIKVCDLSDIGPDPATSLWANMPQAEIAIDPVLGRIAFPKDVATPVHVSFRYGFSADMGGGEYDRGMTFGAKLRPLLWVSAEDTNTQVRHTEVQAQYATIQEALDALEGGGAVEIVGSGRYAETLSISVARNRQLELRAANACRPTLVLGGDLIISGDDSGEVALNGLLMSGGQVRVPAQVNGQPNRLQRLWLRHCTLVPGLTLSRTGAPRQPDAPSLIVESTDTTVEIDHCIVGGLRVVDGVKVRISNSIVDAMADSNVAYAGLDGNAAGGLLRIENSTVIGKVRTLLIKLASNTIFLAQLAVDDTWPAPVIADQRQQGCVRFSYLPLESEVPRRYYCQPKSAEQAARVRPQFTSLRYGDAGYAQLSQRCAPDIRRGADDEAEVGAFHNLNQPQRETNLRVCLNEYLRFGVEAGIFYAS